MPQQSTGNTLDYGVNPDILREYIPSASVDLIDLDPRFDSRPGIIGPSWGIW